MKYESNLKLESNFKSESTTGFKESKDHIWLHPPRADKFKKITQLAPYPQIELPSSVGQEYTGSIFMASNWGEWSGKSSTYFLKVDSTFLDSAINEEVVSLSGLGYLEKDTCSVNYLFSSKLGFYYWHYTYNNAITFEMK